jgi:hypothetical protein
MNLGLPGEDIIEAGVHDLRPGRETIAALLVAARPRTIRIQRIRAITPSSEDL